MTPPRPKLWLKRGFAILVVGGLVLAGTGVVFRSTLSARYASYRLRTADGDEARTAALHRLLDLGAAGADVVAAEFARDDEAACRLAAACLRDRLAGTTPTDPKYADLSRPAFAGFAGASAAGRAELLDLIPELARGADAAAYCRDVVQTGLAADAPAGVKRAAVRQAHVVGLKGDVVPLLADADPAVRKAALLAVGPAGDDGAAVVTPEDLFRCLHDADGEVRDLSAAALASRGLDLGQISLARQLTHPELAERLALLSDLATGAAGVTDPGPWLERLSRDADPAVRLGTARVAAESRLQFAGWVETLAAADADPTVRRWASYYRDQAAAVRQTGAETP